MHKEASLWIKRDLPLEHWKLRFSLWSLKVLKQSNFTGNLVFVTLVTTRPEDWRKDVAGNVTLQYLLVCSLISKPWLRNPCDSWLSNGARGDWETCGGGAWACPSAGKMGPHMNSQILFMRSKFSATCDCTQHLNLRNSRIHHLKISMLLT